MEIGLRCDCGRWLHYRPKNKVNHNNKKNTNDNSNEPATVVSIIIGALRTISSGFDEWIRKLPMKIVSGG